MPAELSWKGLVAFGASGGLVPCESALVLLLGAIALGRVGLGLLLLVSFSLGLALVLMAIGMAVLYAKNLIPESRRTSSHPFIQVGRHRVASCRPHCRYHHDRRFSRPDPTEVDDQLRKIAKILHDPNPDRISYLSCCRRVCRSRRFLYRNHTRLAKAPRRRPPRRGSWLTLVGLFWLKPGDNTIGSDPKNDFVLPKTAPAQIGRLHWAEGKVL